MRLFLLISFILFSSLNAAELTEQTRSLGPGEKATFHPKQGESLSVIKDLDHIVPDANYDIQMRNGAHIYFQNKNVSEDTYIIFNEERASGDVVLVKINKGYFLLKTQSYRKLPKTVKKLLHASAKKKEHRIRIDKENNIIIESDAFCFDDQGEIVPCNSPAALTARSQSTEVVSQPKGTETNTTTEHDRNQTAAATVKAQKKEEKKAGVIDLFTQKLKSAFEKITRVLKEKSPTATVQKKEEVSKKLSNESNRTERKTAAQVKMPSMVKASEQNKTDIEHFNKLSQKEISATAPIARPKFETLPPVPPSGSFEQVNAKSFPAPSAVTSSVEIANRGIDAEASKVPSGVIEKPVIASATLPQDRLPVTQVSRQTRPQASRLSVPREEIPTASVISKPVTPPVAYPAMTLPTAPSATRPTLSSSPTPPVPSAAVSQKERVPAVMQQRPPVAAQPKPQTLQAPPVLSAPSAPVIPEQVPVVAKTETQKPQPVQPPVVTEQSEATQPQSNKIVITKIISKKSTPGGAEGIDSMRNRVIGGGYADRNPTGKVHVKAYCNRKPVSAWVEVFKGKHRVKTFYTGIGKEVRLPAGTYVLKATYRSGTSKQRKNLGKIRLDEGETVHKRVYFSVGKLIVVAKRKGQPAYVKIEIYKHGSKSRYAYTFSSPETGTARLQLSAGTYRIVVKEHGNTKTFDNIRIKGDTSRTLRVDF